jgi:hypothetical protein
MWALLVKYTGLNGVSNFYIITAILASKYHSYANQFLVGIGR